MDFLLTLFTIFATICIRDVAGICNVCSVLTAVACISETEFKYCQSGVPIGAIQNCPNDHVCVDDLAICDRLGAVSPSCESQCGKCGPGSRFACINQNQFAFCFGSSNPSSTLGTCGVGTVCNNALLQFCGDPTLVSADCAELATTTVIPTTESEVTTCGVCSVITGVACISETQFKFCNSGIPIGAIRTCPNGNVCVDDLAVCVPTDVAAPRCKSQCGKCGPDLRFACINQNQFAWCFGFSSPSSTIGTCEPGTVCNNALPEFCGDPTLIVSDCEEPATTTVIPTTESEVTTCGVCSVITGVACISETQYQFCQSGVPIGAIQNCRNGNVCVDDLAICVPNDVDAPSCKSQCGKCGPDLRIACINQNQFAFCFGSSNPSSTIGTCEPGTVCNNALPEFCGDPTVTVSDCEEPATTTVIPTTESEVTTCGVCSVITGVACVSETEFKFCQSGIPIGAIRNCPSGKICVDDWAICVSPGTVAPSCESQCGKCGPDLRFACINQNQFAFCFGSSDPSSSIGTCKPGTVCNNALPKFCDDPTLISADCAEPALTTVMTTTETEATTTVAGICGTCSEISGVACVSETQFRICESGIPIGAIQICPNNNVCVDDLQICVPTDVAAPSCKSQCGKCGPDLRFACVNQNQFAFCFGSSNPSSTIGTCKPGTVCNNALPEFCGDPTLIVSDCEEPATTTVITTTETEAPTTEAPLCEEPGRFPVLGDTTCKQYLYCYYCDSILKAEIFKCPGISTYCHSKQKCVIRTSPICTCYTC